MLGMKITAIFIGSSKHAMERRRISTVRHTGMIRQSSFEYTSELLRENKDSIFARTGHYGIRGDRI